MRDLAHPHPMQRLLQGDVGSGKTIVAAIACLAAVDSGAQAAVMAPTELLSEQHFRKFNEWLQPLGVNIAWLHGGLARAEKRRVLGRIAAGGDGIVDRHACARAAGRGIRAARPCDRGRAASVRREAAPYAAAQGDRHARSCRTSS